MMGGRKGLQKKIFIIGFVVILVIVIFYQEVITREIGERQDVILLRKDSWFEKFEVRENKVFVKCHLKFKMVSDWKKNKRLRLTVEDTEKYLKNIKKILNAQSKDTVKAGGDLDSIVTAYFK